MSNILGELRSVRSADVFKARVFAARLNRVADGGIAFSYEPSYLAGGPGATSVAISTTLPLTESAVVVAGVGLPPFSSGLLPEGHRLAVLRSALKTSLDDELTLLLAVGSDLPGDVQVVPAGELPQEQEPLADTTESGTLDFDALARAVDLTGIPGVQNKASASMRSAPLSTAGARYILKLDSREYPHLIANEMIHLTAARHLRLRIAEAQIVVDRSGALGLLVQRFDRLAIGDGMWARLPV